jgi:hypothetical protein
MNKPEIVNFVYLIYAICGICPLVSGIAMLWHLPNYKRRVESGEIHRGKSRPSFKTLKFAAVGMVIFGLAIVVGVVFRLF